MYFAEPAVVAGFFTGFLTAFAVFVAYIDIDKVISASEPADALSHIFRCIRGISCHISGSSGHISALFFHSLIDVGRLSPYILVQPGSPADCLVIQISGFIGNVNDFAVVFDHLHLALETERREHADHDSPGRDDRPKHARVQRNVQDRFAPALYHNSGNVALMHNFLHFGKEFLTLSADLSGGRCLVNIVLNGYDRLYNIAVRLFQRFLCFLIGYPRSVLHQFDLFQCNLHNCPPNPVVLSIQPTRQYTLAFQVSHIQMIGYVTAENRPQCSRILLIQRNIPKRL